MVAAIGASPANGGSVSGSGTAAAGLEAQLSRYQKELSDCVNCDSSKTPEGQAQIQTISNKISAVRARIDEIGLSKPVEQPATASAGTSIETAAGKQLAVQKVDNNVPADAAITPRRNDSAVGSIVDVFA